MSPTDPATDSTTGTSRKSFSWTPLAWVFVIIAVAATAITTYQTVRENEGQIEMLKLAVVILKEYPATTAEDHALRQWAVAIVDRYSSVEMPESARFSLLNPPAQLSDTPVDAEENGTITFNTSEQCLDSQVQLMTQNTEILVAEEAGNCYLRIPSSSGIYKTETVCDFGEDSEVKVDFPGDRYELSYTHEAGSPCVIEARLTRW